jgi:hypothetical protein
MSSVKRLLGKLLQFLTLCPSRLKEKLKDNYEQFKPIRVRQTVLRAQLIVELLLDLVNLLMNKSSNASLPKRDEVVFQCFLLLRFIIKDYPKNGFFVYDHLDFLKKQVLKKALFLTVCSWKES